MQSSEHGGRGGGSLGPEDGDAGGIASDGRPTHNPPGHATAGGRDDARYTDPEWLESMYWGREMSMAEIAEEVGLSRSGVRYWMEKLGVERRDQERAASVAVAEGNRVSEGELRADVRRVARELDAAPTRAEYDVHGAHHSETVRRRLGDGSWTGALDAVGVRS